MDGPTGVPFPWGALGRAVMKRGKAHVYSHHFCMEPAASFTPFLAVSSPFSLSFVIGSQASRSWWCDAAHAAQWASEVCLIQLIPFWAH